jgi:hypothetical protein
MSAIFETFYSNVLSAKGMYRMKRWVFVAGVLLAGLLAFTPGCSKKGSSQSSNVALTKEALEQTAAGVTWSYPSRWTKGGPRTMRIVTYVVPAAEGDPEAAECAVSYFGSGAGGDVEMNIQRWVGQFDGSPVPVRKEDKVSGMSIAKVEIAGAYLAPAGPMMASQGKKENFKLLGAIVEAPEGKLFFKLTGPAKTVQGAAAELDALLGSIEKK